MFHLDFPFQSERVPNPSEICFTLLMTFWSFMAILGFCIVGELVTDRFNIFNSTLCTTDWYGFPIELKRILVIFVAVTQKSVTLHGSGKTAFCRLEAFKKVTAALTRSHWTLCLTLISCFNHIFPLDMWRGIFLLHDSTLSYWSKPMHITCHGLTKLRHWQHGYFVKLIWSVYGTQMRTTWVAAKCWTTLTENFWSENISRF